MQTIQLVLSDSRFAEQLKQLLAENGNWAVCILAAPNFSRGSVVVLDQHTLQALSAPPDYPDRVVVITHKTSEALSQAWDKGIRSVVYDSDPPNTLLLAIMAAYLRLPRSAQLPKRRMRAEPGVTRLLNIDL